MTVKDFLNRYPWSAAETQGRRPLDYLWSFHLQASPEELWPLLVDTSNFNRMLGLPAMHYREENGALYGQATNAGIRLEWREVPWEWNYLEGLNNARVYSRGFAHYVRARYLLQPREDGTTELLVYFGWIPRGVKGALLLKAAMPQLRKKYAAALDTVEKTIRARTSFFERERDLRLKAQPPQISESGLKLLEETAAEAIRLGADPEITDFLKQYIREAPDDEIYRLRLARIARERSLDLSRLLITALYASRSGLLSLSWDTICPHCRGVRNEVTSIGQLVEDASCEVCDIQFKASGKDNIEVVFHVNPQIRPAVKKFFCAAEPAMKRHVFIQRHLAAGERLTIETLLPSGRYRIYFRGSNLATDLMIEQDGSREISFSGTEESLQAGPSPRLIVKNSSDRPATVLVEQAADDIEALRPSNLFTIQTFRDLFPGEAVAQGLKLELGLQTILFTDIVGSTRFYRAQGDAGAFARVREHFIVLYDIISRHHGAVVKTIGDAAMAAFSRPGDALLAAREIQAVFAAGRVADIRLRVAIHCGDCLAVNLNSGIDYFGNTVNTAAKLQSLAGANEVIISAELAEKIGASFEGLTTEAVPTDLLPSGKAFKLR